MTNTPIDNGERPRTAVGMSGGLDSSVVAALCVDRGHDVMGLTLHMFKEGSRCCSIEDVQRARAVCDHFGIPHYVINAMDLFEDTVIKPFVEGYASGRTPSPCILCNEHIKFGILHRRAVQLGCRHIATGHYARIEHRNDRWRLLRPRDRDKDQTYFLHRLSQDQLERSLFPLETMTKPEVRAYAREKHLPFESSRGESQDLCFVPDDGHAAFVEGRRPDLKKSGEVIDGEGTVLGTHEGVHRYTVGQRSGLGVAARTRLYVNRLEADRDRVVVGTRDEATQDRCRVENMHWISGDAPTETFRCNAQVRYRHEPAPCMVYPVEPDEIRLEFDEPQFAITPGQAAVLYNEDEILGGGWISSRTYDY